MIFALPIFRGSQPVKGRLPERQAVPSASLWIQPKTQSFHVEMENSRLQPTEFGVYFFWLLVPPPAAQFCRCVCRSFRLDSVRLWRVGRRDVHRAMRGVCRIGDAFMGPLIRSGSTRRHRRQGAETWRRK